MLREHTIGESVSIDTAGIRQGSDLVETLGIERSYQAMADADLTLVVLDASSPVTYDDEKLLERARQLGRHLVVHNKSDLVPSTQPLAVSALTGEGIDNLRQAIREAVGLASESAQESGFITSLRHEQLLRESIEALRKAAQAVEFTSPTKCSCSISTPPSNPSTPSPAPPPPTISSTASSPLSASESSLPVKLFPPGPK